MECPVTLLSRSQFCLGRPTRTQSDVTVKSILLPNCHWYTGRRWIDVFPGNATFTAETFNFIDLRTRFFTFASCVSSPRQWGKPDHPTAVITTGVAKTMEEVKTMNPDSCQRVWQVSKPSKNDGSGPRERTHGCLGGSPINTEIRPSG